MSAKIEKRLGLARGTVRAATKLGMDSDSEDGVRAWIAEPRAPWPAPFGFVGSPTRDPEFRAWALVKPEEVDRVVAIERVEIPREKSVRLARSTPALVKFHGESAVRKLCPRCMAEWAPSARWQRIGAHFRARHAPRRRQDPTVPRDQFRQIEGPEVTIACGACLGRVARVWLPDYRGLVTLHPDVPEAP